jgi:hypothetical protein
MSTSERFLKLWHSCREKSSGLGSVLENRYTEDEMQECTGFFVENLSCRVAI